MNKLLLFLLLLIPVSALAQTPSDTCANGDQLVLNTSLKKYQCVTPGTQPPPVGSGTNMVVANASSTGTTVNRLAKLTGAPSTAVVTGTSDTENAIGIVVSGAGTTGSATITILGQATCDFDNATVAGDYFTISAITVGKCHDAGSTYPSAGATYGRVLSTNVASGAYVVELMTPDIAFQNAGNGRSKPGGSNTQLQYNSNGATFGGISGALTDGTNLTVSTALNSCADAGANDTYACSLSPSPGAYATRQIYWFTANTANTGAATINFNSLGAKTITKLQGGITTTLADNDIRAGQAVEVMYDGTQMQMLSALGNTSTTSIAPLVIEDANTVAIRNGANNELLYGYGTYTSGSNYERYRLGGDASASYFEFSAEQAGAGALRSLKFRVGATKFFQYNGDQFMPSASGTQDLGFSSLKWNDIWGTRVLVTSVNLSTSKGVLTDASGTTFGGVLKITSGLADSGTWTGGSVTQSTFTTNKDNFDPQQYGYHERWSSDASRNVTGWAHSQVDGEVHLITNVGSNPIVLVNESGSSTAANRFTNNTGADIVLNTNDSASIIYDSTTTRWRVSKDLTSGTNTNCSDSAGAAACGAAAAGSVVIDAGSTSVVVSTTAITANSQVFVQYDSGLGTRLSVTCNTTPAIPAVTARTAATSFTITVPLAPTANPACYSYFIMN